MNSDIQLRDFPYPYRSMLAICSDLDNTPDRHVYMDIMRYLNTTETTSMGQGVGLEVGNSIHFRALPRQFSYWNTDDAGREMVRMLIRSGHIDCLHSFGELISTRDEAERALNELTLHNCHLEVWVDHGGAATNFGPDIMQGHGDEIGHPAYHADLTMDYGIKYVWRGRVTSITGQDVPASLKGIFNWKHPRESGRTLIKEATKRQLARRGNRRYAMHGTNQTLRRVVLRDRSLVYEFIRCNPHWGGINSCEQGRYIGKVLTDSMLDRLISRSGTCILYTHLGKIDDPDSPFDKTGIEAFRRLAEAFRCGTILVTTTRRLLGYRRAVREIRFNYTSDNSGLQINLNIPADKKCPGQLSGADLSGLTFYVPNSKTTYVTIEGQKVANLKHNAPDHTGRPSVSLAWPILKFPLI
ncbi:MAG: hypothetical protein U9Q07_06000 [Planctomycetota bacterium]|nr:hypothetical protein [Planctomycetota bacterium]